MPFQVGPARKSQQQALNFTTADRASSLREKVREKIYASGKQKSVAIECYGASGQSRLTRALSAEHEGDVSLDIDLLVPILQELGDEAALEVLSWLAGEFNSGDTTLEVRRVQKLPLEERLAQIELAAEADDEALTALLNCRRERAATAAALRAELARKKDGLE